MGRSTLGWIAVALAATLAAAPAQAAADPVGEVRMAKIGLADFLLGHVDRPLRVDEPCPALAAESAAQHLGALGLQATERPYGPAVVWDRAVGSGLVALRCGNDLAQPPQPAGAVRLSIDVTMLDGQATFAQYAVAIGGNDVVIDRVADLARPIASRCTNGGRDCVAAVETDGIVVTVRLRGLPADTGEQRSRQLAVAVRPEIVAHLAARGDAVVDG